VNHFFDFFVACIVAAFLYSAYMVADKASEMNKDWEMTVATKGANDIIYRSTFHTLKGCLNDSPTYHKGGYEVNCKRIEK